MKNTQNFSFSEWLASRKAISFTLAIGVIFLIGCYTKIIHVTNPDANNFAYWQWLIILLSHIDALFFGLCTIVLMYQASKNWHKVLFCTFEGSMIFLYVNQGFLSDLGVNPGLVLGLYLGMFGGFAMYFLGSLSKAHREESNQIQSPSPTPSQSNPGKTEDEIEEEKILKEAQDILSKNGSSKNTVIAGLRRYNEKPKSEKAKAPKGYSKLAKLFEQGLSVNEAAKRANVSWNTAKKAKLFYES